MSAQALALVISGALLHALWNLFAKKAAGGLAFVWLFGAVSVLVSLPFGAAALQAHSHQLTAPVWAAIAGSAAVHVAYSLVLQKGYRESDFSVVYPLARGTGPLFAVLGAIAVLGEMPSGPGWCGIAAVLAGIFLLAGLGRLSHPRTARASAGVFWGVLTGLTIAAYTVIDGWAVKALGVDPLLYYFLGLVLRTAILAPQALHARDRLAAQWRSNGRYAVAVGVLSPLAYTLVLYAVTMAPLSYVAPVRELSMLIGVLAGARVLREVLDLPRVAGTVCMVAGVVLLALAG